MAFEMYEGVWLLTKRLLTSLASSMTKLSDETHCVIRSCPHLSDLQLLAVILRISWIAATNKKLFHTLVFSF